MLARIAAFELRYQIRSPLFFIGFAMFFLLSFTSVASDKVHIGSVGNVHVNAPYAILQTMGVLCVFATFVVTAFVANVVIRDQESGFAPILYATRLTKRDYLIGRFSGALLVALLLMASVPLGIFLGSSMPWLDPEKVGSQALSYYLYALGVITLPMLLVTGACFFTLATVTRSMMWTYVGVVAFLVLYFTALTLFRNPEYDQVTALLDPFGIATVDLVTKYWTPAERNTRLPGLTGVMLESRLLWVGVGLVMFAVAYALFRFEARGVRHAPRAGALTDAAPRTLQGTPTRTTGGWGAFLATVRLEMRSVFSSAAFGVLLALAVLNTFAYLVSGLENNGVEYLPVTRAMVEGLRGAFTQFPVIIAIYYGGELVWRERERRFHEIVDACPVPGWAIVLPKILAISLVLLGTLIVGVLTAMGVQLMRGYHQLEPWHYVLWFLLPGLSTVCLFAVLSVVVQSIVPHKAIGWAVMLLYIVSTATLDSLGFQNGLYHYAFTASVPLSDMNGMGRFWIGRTWFEVYWLAFAAMLVVAALLLWRRGAESRFRPRLVLAWRQLKGATALVMALAALAWIGTGAYIYYNTHILNDYAGGTDVALEHRMAAYERALLPYESVPQPTITAVKLDVQLYPRQVRADTRGSYELQNRTAAPITQVHVRWERRLQLQELDLGPATLERDYKDFHYRVYRLTTPMAPGERRTLRFRTRLEEQGFPNQDPLTRIVDNGTFVANYLIAPGLGMERSELLKDRSVRRRNGLPADLRPPKLEDTAADAHHYIRHDSDWVDAEIRVTTDADQVPLAPGYTVSDEIRDGRRTLVTRTEAPIMNYFSIQSARYAIRRDVWQGADGHKVDLAVYHHPGHPYNVARVITAMKASLDVFSTRFAPYQFRQARILEFPAYATFAESFANTIPFSEGIGFVQSFDEKEAEHSIDLVTFVTAHELGHQWWGHQIIGADKQGGTMLSESFAQYSALLVMEKLYGREHIRKFLKNELDQYLRSRGVEGVEELPLERVENQGYIHYRKGALVMYGLKDALGEEVVNRALRRLLAAHAFKAAPYPDTREFLRYLQEEAGPGHEQLIGDLFERITLYDLKAHDAHAHRLPDGRYEVRFTVDGAKFYADGAGAETSAPLADTFEVGAFTVEPGTKGYSRKSILRLERQALRSGSQTLTLVVDQPPRFVGIDPFNVRIDRKPEDNLTPVTLDSTPQAPLHRQAAAPPCKAPPPHSPTAHESCLPG